MSRTEGGLLRIDAVRKLWDRLRAPGASGGRALEEESESFTSSELAVGRMVLPVLQDLDEARRSLGELETSVHALRAALETLPVAALVLDGQSRLLTSNGAAQSLFGGAAVSEAVVEAAARAVATGTEKTAALVRRVDGSILRVVPGRLAGAAHGEPAVVFLIPQNAPIGVDTDLLRSRYALSPTQAKVVSLVAQGLTNKEVAARLDLSAETVHKHLNAVFQRTGLRTRAAVVALAFGAPFGLVPPEAS